MLEGKFSVILCNITKSGNLKLYFAENLEVMREAANQTFPAHLRKDNKTNMGHLAGRVRVPGRVG